MKIDRLIVLHLYKYKQVTLQGIGSFYIDPSAVMPLEIDNGALAENAISFDYNAKAPEDSSLIDTIVQYTKKLKPLASADLDSFLHWQKQLLNINMPFTLLNVGMLQKTLQGQVVFVPFKPSPSEIKAINASVTNTRYINANVEKYRNLAAKYGKKISLVVVVIAGLSLTAWAFFYYGANQTYYQQSFKKQREGLTAGATNDTLKKDSSRPVMQIQTTYSPPADKKNVFKVIFLETKREIDAIKKLNEIYGFGHSGIMYLKDSSYKIAIPFSRPLSDTSLIKDSLNKYYSLGEGHVEVE